MSGTSSSWSGDGFLKTGQERDSSRLVRSAVDRLHLAAWLLNRTFSNFFRVGRRREGKKRNNKLRIRRKKGNETGDSEKKGLSLSGANITAVSGDGGGALVGERLCDQGDEIMKNLSREMLDE